MPHEWLIENERDGSLMVLVPEGEFVMGSDAYSRDKPVRRVHLDAYRLGLHPVTVGQFRRYCNAAGVAYDWTRHTPGWGWKDDHPMVRVTWDESRAYCRWAGGDLPTEAQWEKAARGADGRVYPWGDPWDPARCRHSAGKSADSTSSVWGYPSGASPYGLLDMAGNVWEWCLDWFQEGYGALPARNPSGPAAGTGRALRGGSWILNDPVHLRSASRNHFTPTDQSYSYGFRLAGSP